MALDLDPSMTPLATDADRLRIALVNLLVNARQAVKGSAGDRESPVRLRSRAHERHVEIVIADFGAGIAADDLAHIFDPYFTTKRGGTGLGLPIARNIVEGLGGSITVTSQPGRGTEIEVELPFDLTPGGPV